MGEVVRHEGKELIELPEMKHVGVEVALARAVRQQRLAATAYSRLGMQRGHEAIPKYKERGEMIAQILDDIFPMEDGSWGNLIDQLSGVKREGPVISMAPQSETQEPLPPAA